MVASWPVHCLCAGTLPPLDTAGPLCTSSRACLLAEGRGRPCSWWVSLLNTFWRPGAPLGSSVESEHSTSHPFRLSRRHVLGLGVGQDKSTVPQQCPRAGIRGSGRAHGIPRLRPICLSSGGGHIKEVIVASEAEPGDSGMAEARGSPNRQGPGLSGEGEQAQVKLLVNKDGRYVCMLCHKTFKTVRPWGRGHTGCGSQAFPLLPREVPEPRRPSPTGQHP